MGFKVVDITPLGTLSPITPASKDVVSKAFVVSRTDTATVVKVEIPADASLTGVVFNGTTTSDAQTTASIAITVTDNTATVCSGTVNVKSVTTTGFVTMTNTPNLEPLPLNGDLLIKAVYSETGTASATGGPWYFIVTYVR